MATEGELRTDYETAAVGQDPHHDIVPRDIRFGIAGNAVRHWFGGNIFKTVMVDGLSIFLPEGERFFIRSLKHYAAELPAGDFATEIRGYSIQEAFHTREHEAYNQGMAELGYDLEAMEQPIRLALGKVTNPIVCLAVTCAIEHLTATFATVTLRRPSILDDAAPAYRRLWMWHALEELEHKAVAFDVFKAATPNLSGWKRYTLRTVIMNAMFPQLFVIYVRNVGIYARKDGLKTGWRFWLRFAWTCLMSPGVYGRSIAYFLLYYLPGYNPRNVDDGHLVRFGREWLARDMAPAT